MTFSFKVPIQKIINFFRLIHSTIVFAESFFLRTRPVCPTFCILQFSTFHVRTYIKSSEFQSRSELLIIENCLPLTDEVTVDLVLKCLQHLHLLALHLEILGVHLTKRVQKKHLTKAKKLEHINLCIIYVI